MSDFLMRVQNARVQHPIYEWANRLMRSYLAFANDSTIILIIGPSKVGKSTLLSDLYADHLPVDDRIPMIVTDAVALSQRFSMLHLTGRCLRELGHPLYVVEDLKAWMQKEKTKPLSETFARPLLEEGLTLRNCMYIGIDECHHIVTSTASVGALYAVESLKCLLHINPSDAIKQSAHTPGMQRQRRIGIFCGGYKMLDDSLMSAHFSNRLVVLHFKRYQDTESERMQFAAALKGFEEVVRPEIGPRVSLLDFEDIIYGGTFGCFGNAINWILLAIAAKHAMGNMNIKEEHFLETRTLLQLEESLEEILEGEARIATLTKRALLEKNLILESPGDHTMSNSREGSKSKKRSPKKPRTYSTKKEV